MNRKAFGASFLYLIDFNVELYFFSLNWSGFSFATFWFEWSAFYVIEEYKKYIKDEVVYKILYIFHIAI